MKINKIKVRNETRLQFTLVPYNYLVETTRLVESPLNLSHNRKETWCDVGRNTCLHVTNQQRHNLRWLGMLLM